MREARSGEQTLENENINNFVIVSSFNVRGTIERRKKLYMGSKSSSALGRSVGTPSKR